MEKTFKYDGEEPVRINKWLAQNGVCSRREAEDLISKNLILVNNKEAIIGQKLEKNDVLKIISKGMQTLNSGFDIIYHKPVGIVSGQPERGEIPAIRMLTQENNYDNAEIIPNRDDAIPPLGRLDKDSRGLLILSQDGVLAKSIIGPDSDLEKEYIVTVKGYITEVKLKLLNHGLELDGRKLKPAVVTNLGESKLNFILKEGRNRQIRRMCDLLELKVVDLFRIRIGNLKLSDLPEGKWRNITENEKLEFTKR